MKKIEKYIDELFSDLPSTKKTKELKEEMLADLEDKYNDLIKANKDEKEAYKEVIAGIGDIDELRASLIENQDYSLIEKEIIKKQKQRGLIVSISVGLYILSIICIAVVESLGLPEFIGLCGFLTIAGLSTCLLIYHFVSTPSKPEIEFKKVNPTKIPNDSVLTMKKAIHSILWLSILTLYFIISFLFRAWAVSWIIFLIGVIIQNIIDLIINLKENNYE